MKSTLANLVIRQLGTCMGPDCDRPLSMSAEDDLYVCCKNVVLGFCSQACCLRRMALMLRSRRADRKISEADLLSGLGYDPTQPQPALEAEGSPAAPRKKRKRN